MKTTDPITETISLLADAVQSAIDARTAELLAAEHLDIAARAYTKAVKDWEPRKTIHRLDEEMAQSYRTLNFRTGDRYYAEQMRDGIATALASLLAKN